VTRITEGFSYFVTFIAAPVASGWSICRAGLTPAGKRHLFTAHTHCSRSTQRDIYGGFQRYNGRSSRRIAKWHLND
jgi:hypothetical protein